MLTTLTQVISPRRTACVEAVLRTEAVVVGEPGLAEHEEPFRRVQPSRSGTPWECLDLAQSSQGRKQVHRGGFLSLRHGFRNAPARGKTDDEE